MATLQAAKSLTNFSSKDEAALETGNYQQPIEQTVEKLPNGTRRLAARLNTPVKPEHLWSVLTDYNHLSGFIPNLSKSKLVSRTANKVILDQVGCQKFIGINFSAYVQIELQEDQSSGTLSFHLIKGDFRRFDGVWRIQSLSNQGTCLFYELTVQGCVGMPVSLIENRLKDDLTANLLSVEQEALTRDIVNLASN